MNKINLGISTKTSTIKNATKTNFYFGTVVSVNDPNRANRIKVRIDNIDGSDISEDKLPYVSPLLQKLVNIQPKVGETVIVFIHNTENDKVDRFFVGPIISQLQFKNNDSALYSGRKGTSRGVSELGSGYDSVPENYGVYPKEEDVALIGRDNSDIILKSNEVLVRSGIHGISESDIPKLNIISPSYIQLKNGLDITDDDNKNEGVINIVSNKINLLTHRDSSIRYDINGAEDKISDEELTKILNESHPLVFGDTLVEYLKKLNDAFMNHVHAFPGMKADNLSGDNSIQEYNNFDLNSLLSKNIKIN